MNENFQPVEYTERPPFTARRSYHFWAYQFPNKCPPPTKRDDGTYQFHWDHIRPIPQSQLESMQRIRWGCGHGGPNDLRPEFCGGDAL